MEVVVSATGPLLLLSPPDGVLATDRFGFFGLTATADVSEPDFLSFTDGAVDFLPGAPLPLPFDSSPPAALLLASAGDPASSPLDAAEEPEDPVVLDVEDDPASDPDEESEDDFEEELDADPEDDFEEEFDADEESDDELDELEEPVSVGPAQATPGVVATATPTPKATAKLPTRPMYLA
jgi:hypothetical protein